MDLLLRAMQKEEFDEGYLLINEVSNIHQSSFSSSILNFMKKRRKLVNGHCIIQDLH